MLVKLQNILSVKTVSILFLLIFCSIGSRAVSWEFIEVDVSLRPDGKATIVYHVAINPQGFSLHGFYFEGFTGTPHFDPEKCHATDSNSNNKSN